MSFDFWMAVITVPLALICGIYLLVVTATLPATILIAWAGYAGYNSIYKEIKNRRDPNGRLL